MEFNRYKCKIDNIHCEKNVTIYEPCNLYRCYIKKNSFIGPFTEIQEHVVIGNNCKIQSHSFICSEVIIGDNCFIGHGVIFTNDKFSNGKLTLNKSDWIETNVGNNILIGSGSTILPVTICDNVVIGAGSVVTKDIKNPGTYAGNPAKELNSGNNKTKK